MGVCGGECGLVCGSCGCFGQATDEEMMSMRKRHSKSAFVFIWIFIQYESLNLKLKLEHVLMSRSSGLLLPGGAGLS